MFDKLIVDEKVATRVKLSYLQLVRSYLDLLEHEKKLLSSTNVEAQPSSAPPKPLKYLPISRLTRRRRRSFKINNLKSDVFGVEL